LSKCGLLIISHQWKFLDKRHCKISCLCVFYVWLSCTCLGITNVGQVGMELDGSMGVGDGANVMLKSKIKTKKVVVM
jgi:hypothetical protein